MLQSGSYFAKHFESIEVNLTTTSIYFVISLELIQDYVMTFTI